MRKIESLRALGLLTVAALAVWGTVAVLRLPSVPPAVPNHTGPLIDIISLKTVGFTETRRSWTLAAHEGTLERDRDTLTLRGCTGTLLPPEADPIAFTSSIALYKKSSQTLECPQGAQFVAADSLSFRVPFLTWTGKENVISAPGDVTATGEGFQMSAKNLRLNLKAQELQVDDGEARIQLSTLEKLGGKSR